MSDKKKRMLIGVLREIARRGHWGDVYNLFSEIIESPPDMISGLTIEQLHECVAYGNDVLWDSDKKQVTPCDELMEEEFEGITDEIEIDIDVTEMGSECKSFVKKESEYKLFLKSCEEKENTNSGRCVSIWDSDYESKLSKTSRGLEEKYKLDKGAVKRLNDALERSKKSRSVFDGFDL